MSKDFLRDLQKINPYAEVLELDSLSTISDWISTGSLSLNSIISGDFNKGIPVGRTITFNGQTGVGKSLIAGMIATNAIKGGYEVIWFDTEFATDKDFLKRLGADTSKIIKSPIGSIEQFKNQVFKILQVHQEKYPDKKILIILDSLGNLASEKEIEDAEKDKNASDMGLRAKIIKSMFRLISDKVGKQRIGFVIINHVYSNPGNPYIGLTASGGSGPEYLSHIAVTFTRSKVKDESSKQVTGTILKGTTSKNRIIPPFKIAEIYLDFQKGMDKYYGLLDMGIESGLIIKEGTRYKTVKNDKLHWEKDIYCDEFFSSILDDLNKYNIENVKYSSVISEKEEKVKGGKGE